MFIVDTLAALIHNGFKDQSHKYYEEGAKHLEAQEYDQAIEAFSNMLRWDPDNLSAIACRAGAYLDKGDYKQSIAEYNYVINRKPSYMDLNMLYIGRAQAYAWDKNYQAAIADYTRSLNLEKAAQTYIARGKLYFYQRDLDKAEADFTEAIQLSPEKSTQIHIEMGWIALKKEGYQKAIAEFTQAIANNLQISYAYLNRGYCYLKLKDWEHALGDFEESIRINPNDAIAHTNRGKARFELGDIDGAIADYSQCMTLDPQLHYPHLGMGCLNFAAENFQTARGNFQHALDLKSDDEQAKAGLAVTHYALGEKEAALALWHELIAKNEQYHDMDWLKKEYLWSQNMFDTAAQLINEIS